MSMAMDDEMVTEIGEWLTRSREMDVCRMMFDPEISKLRVSL